MGNIVYPSCLVFRLHIYAKETPGQHSLAWRRLATLLVKNLDSARNYYANVLGFNLPLREKFEQGIYKGTLVAAIGFPDISALELLSIEDTQLVAANHSFISSFLKRSEGLGSYSLGTSSVDTTLNWLQSQGFKTDTPRSGRFSTAMPKGWDYDDGEAQFRSIGFSRKNSRYDLPNFTQWPSFPYYEMISSWKPYAWRKYYEEQPNGVVGITSLLIIVGDLEVAGNEFKAIGLQELEANDTLVRFRIAHSQELHLMAPRVKGDKYSRFLQKQGASVYAVRFEVKDLKQTKDFLKKKLPAAALIVDSIAKHLTVQKEFALGVQLEFTEESKEQASLAKIYSFKEGVKLDTASIKYASGMYAKYCALCHGKDREGYAADFAPSLRSKNLMAITVAPASNFNFLSHTISYGRTGTAMAPYAKSQGGPLEEDDIEVLLLWLHESSGVKKPIELSAKPIRGNVTQGKALYKKHCASCHGEKGEGGRAPAIANPMLLATASDALLHYTISHGRDGTPMPAFKDSLQKTEINSLTAYIRSRASGWNAPEAITLNKPLPKDYVLNPTNKAPKFTLRKGKYLAADQLRKALQDSGRIMLLDARSEAAWHQAHIPGAIPVPYYEEPDKFVKDIPNDSTWIVAYCACPHAASDKVVTTLRRLGYKNTAILDEGILVWTQRGYPVQNGHFSRDKKVAPKRK